MDISTDWLEYIGLFVLIVVGITALANIIKILEFFYNCFSCVCRCIMCKYKDYQECS